ncbi:MaoC/PaaZ C-terminal domain-containing protein [Sedimenticola selenatireducens]|jgi:acyl dehydratase|uniref:Dehydratase n=1 Tax=Sedimenticola selenatireducens TaxID=191960 RepID=A0A558DTJ6_9GAMM|nr:MaoC/PaaZ C-terminal domain-containing protein [Sedimenticola selenatireducens]TVO76937.1 dehydratase [Sedimenticola selenatireducens]TVT64380.1 MAG: dehydratase [Sedimenticola selenatireducens]
MFQPDKNNTYPEQVWFEDFFAGQRFDYGAWLMTQSEMIDFATLYDPEPFHLDEKAAIELGWGGLIASGPQVASIWRRLSKEAFPNAQSVISPGWENIRWIKPVFAGDCLHAHTEISEIRLLASRPGEGMIKLQNSIYRKKDDVVATLSSTWFVRCRP